MATKNFCDKCDKELFPLKTIKTDHGNREFCEKCYKALMKLLGIPC